METDRIKRFFFNTLLDIRESYLRYLDISRSVVKTVSLESSFDNILVFFNPLLVDKIVCEMESLVGDKNQTIGRFMRNTVYGTKIGDKWIGGEEFKKESERLWNDISCGKDKENFVRVCVLRWTKKEFKYIVYNGEDDKVAAQEFLGSYLTPTLCGGDDGLLYENPETGEKECITPQTHIVCFENENKETSFLFLDKDVFLGLFLPKE